MSHTFCAELSLRQGDPLAGSAAHAQHNLLISWPRARWGRSLRLATDMSEALGKRLDTIAAAGRRINLIHRRGQPSHWHRIFLMPERRAYDVQRDRLEDFLDAWQAGEALDEWYREGVEKDLVLCCTHGKKDKCCAKFGFSAYRALARAAESHSLPFDVWECTHLGGCRLAASTVLLSPVRKYGRIAPEHALPLLSQEARGQRYLPCYRGDADLSPAQQCAQIAALTFLARRNIHPHLIVDADQGDEDRRKITLRWTLPGASAGRLSVECRASMVLRTDTCADLETPPTPSRIWQSGRVEELCPVGL